MTDKSWKATFKPAYPVCAGELIFITEGHIEPAQAREIANSIVEAYGRPAVEDLQYLGEFIGSSQFYMNADQPMHGVFIVTIQTGEY